MQRISTTHYYVPTLIFLFFLGFYLFTAKGVLHIGDSMVNFQTTRSLVEDRSLAVTCDIVDAFVVQNENGRCYSKYDPGLPVTAIPLYLVGRFLGGHDPADMYTVSWPKLFASTLSQIVTAATCAVLYILALHIGKDEMTAFGTAFLFGMATIAWPYAGLFFSQSLVAFLLTLAVTLLVITSPQNKKALIGAGLALGWACFTRLDAVPLVFLVIAYALYRQKRAGRGWRGGITAVLLLILPTLTATVLYFAANLLRTGSPFQVGYQNEGWTTPFLTGLAGLLISPGKGIIFYSPLSLLAAIGLIKLWQKGWRAEVLLIGGLAAAQIATYASWWAWEGGESWGPRLILSTQALLMVGLIPWLDNTLPRPILFVAAAAGFLVQIIGAFSETGIFLERTPFTYEQTLFYWRASPIWGQLQDMLNRKYAFLLANRGYGLFSTSHTLLWMLVSVTLMFGSLWLLRTYFREKEVALQEIAHD